MTHSNAANRGESQAAQKLYTWMYLEWFEHERGKQPRTKKPARMAGFSIPESLVETLRYCYLVPRGRLELPLLSKTDFESAASTNSAIRACGGEV